MNLLVVIHYFNVDFTQHIVIDNRKTTYMHYAAAYSDPSTLEFIYHNNPSILTIIDLNGFTLSQAA